MRSAGLGLSRIVYTGAGGFNSRFRQGLQFTLSPRVWHLVRGVSEGSTEARGIFHTKDESLSAEGYHRLHILCGESVCSETAAWLKVGATALVVALIDAGLRDNIEHAMEHAPAVGRARVRGSYVRQLTGGGTRYLCDWRGVWDCEGHRTLDLNDPFATAAEWQTWVPDQREIGVIRARLSDGFAA